MHMLIHFSHISPSLMVVCCFTTMDMQFCFSHISRNFKALFSPFFIKNWRLNCGFILRPQLSEFNGFPCLSYNLFDVVDDLYCFSSLITLNCGLHKVLPFVDFHLHIATGRIIKDISYGA